MTTAADDRSTRSSRLPHLIVAAVGLIVLGVCALIARNGKVSAGERRVFEAINELPEWLYRPLWLFQQFGNVVVAFVVVIVIAVILRKPKLAMAAVGAVVLKLGSERLVKQVVERRRPATSIGDVILRGDVSTSGLSFVSGHAAMTAVMATILTPVLPARWNVLPWVVVALNGLARIYVGAHNPLDVVGGIALGLVIGGLLNAVLAPLHRTKVADQHAPDGVTAG